MERKRRMGHKISPTSLRLDITENWKSRWFSRLHARDVLKQDHLIREFIKDNYKKANILGVDIERTANNLHIIIRTPRPGILIGRGGSGVEEMRKKVQKLAKLAVPPRVTIPTEDINTLANSAQAVASSIAEQMEKRLPYRRVIKQSLDNLMQGRIKGAKIAVGGRLDGGDIARTESLQKGKLPLHTLRANIDFARATAFTTYGTVGVKVWVYKGDVLAKSSNEKTSLPSR